jgi:hypothetical protein
MELNADDQFSDPMEFVDSTKLDAYLAITGTTRLSHVQTEGNVNIEASAQSSVPIGGKSRVLILEGMNPKFVSVLGKHFSLHPSFFVEHERVVVMNKRAESESDGFPLPSVLRNRDHLVMKYFEPMEFNEAPSSFRLVCASSGRHIGVSRDYGQFSDIGIVRRKCTVASKMRELNGGWDCKGWSSHIYVTG